MSGTARTAFVQSRTVLVRCGLLFAWFALLAALPWLVAASTASQAAGAFGTYCSIAALIRLIVTARNREQPGAASLNGWDECLALTAGSLLGRMALHWLGT